MSQPPVRAYRSVTCIYQAVLDDLYSLCYLNYSNYLFRTEPRVYAAVGM